MPSSMGLFAHRAVGFDAWAAGPLAKLCGEADVRVPARDVMFSPHLQVAFTTQDLAGDVPVSDHVVLVGPALAPRRGEPPFPVEWLDPARAHVLLTVGTLNVNVAVDFFRRALQGLAPLGDRLQAIVLAPPETFTGTPSHVRVVPRVDVLGLMPHLDAVVCHAGTNTVGEALAHAVPLVLAPITLDQPRTADQVTRTGAGIRLDFDTATPEELGDAVLAVSAGGAYRAAAERVRDSFTAAGGAATAADRLSRLALTAVAR
jgi:zeaxanthin glucosyltransferase